MPRSQATILKRNAKLAKAGRRAAHAYWFIRGRRDELQLARLALGQAKTALQQSPGAALFLVIVYPHLVLNHIVRDSLALLRDEVQAFERKRMAKAT